MIAALQQIAKDIERININNIDSLPNIRNYSSSKPGLSLGIKVYQQQQHRWHNVIWQFTNHE